MLARFRLLGFPVEIHWTFLAVVAFLGWLSFGQNVPYIAMWLAVVTGSVLWHEVGHAVAMRAFGFSPAIMLHSLGGLTQWGRGNRAPSATQRMIVGLAGPGAGFLVGAAVLLATVLVGPVSSPMIELTLYIVIWVNIGWGVLNLIPMLPLDGGIVLEAALERVRGRPSMLLALRISLVVSVLATVAAVWAGWMWAGMLAAMCAISAFSNLGRASDQTQDRELAPRLEAANQALQQQHFAEAARIAGEVADAARSSWMRAHALTLKAWAHLAEDDHEAAREAAGRLSMQPPEPLLKAIDASRLIQTGEPDKAVDLVLASNKPDPGLMHIVARRLFQHGFFDRSLRVSAVGFEQEHDALHAFNAACALARLGRPEEALTWLHRAADTGLSDIEQLETVDDLESVRALPAYDELRRRLHT